MRIRRFSEARGIFEEEISFEPQIHCFGGGGGGGGGGSADDADSMDSGYDTSTVGMGTNTMGGGPGGAGMGNDNDGDGIPNTIDATPNGGAGTSYSPPSTTTNFGTSSGTANVVDSYNDAVDSIAAGVDVFGPGGAAGAGGPSPGGSDSGFYGPSGYNAPVPAGPSPAPAPAPTPQERMAFVSPSTGKVNTGNFNVSQAKAKGASITDAKGRTVYGDYQTLQDFAKQEGLDPGSIETDRNRAIDSVLSELGVQSPELAPFQQQLLTPMGRAADTYVDEAIDAFSKGDIAGRSPMQSTVDQAKGAVSPADAAAQAFSAPVGVSAPAEEREAPAEGIGSLGYTGAGSLAYGQGTAAPGTQTGIAANPVASVEQAIADFSQGISAGTPTPSTAASTAQTGFAGLGPVGTGQGYSPAVSETVPGFGASVDRAIEDFGAQRVGRTQEMLDDGTVVTEDFGLQRANLVQTPTDFLSSYSPLDQQLMQEGTRALSGVDFSQAGIPTSVDIFGVQVPTGLGVVEGAVNAVFNPAYSTTQAIRAGATPVYGAQGNILGATSEDGSIAYSNDPYGDMMRGFRGELDPAMQAAYDNARAMQDAARGDGGDSEVFLPPIDGGAGEGETVPEEYQGRNIVNDAVYGPAPVTSYNYTGLPSLAPVSLRPSFQARGNYGPLFNFR